MAVTANVPVLPAPKLVEAALVNAGAWPTTTVNVCVASGLIPLLAVTLKVVVPVALGVPCSRAVPVPSSVKVSPAGRVPVSVMAGVGEPVVVMATAPVLVQGEVGRGRARDGRRPGRADGDGQVQRGRATRDIGS